MSLGQLAAMDEMDDHIAIRKIRNREVLEKRRHRTRVKRTFWMTIYLLALGGIAAGTVGFGRYIAGAGHFQATVVTIKGTQHASPDDLMQLVGGARPGNIFLVDLDAVRGRLLAHGWVKDASVARVLPSTIEVHVTEREPVAVAEIDRGLWLVDDTGTSLAPYASYADDFDLPFVTGLGKENRGDMLRLALQALAAVAQCDRSLASSVSEVNCEGESARIVFENGTPALLIGSTDLEERIRFFRGIEKELRAQFARIDYVDIRFAPRIYVKGEFRAEDPGKTTGAVSAEGETRG